jgi:hypothetical protein
VSEDSGFSFNRGAPVPRKGTIRDPSEYEMDLAEAVAFEEPPTPEPRRKSYQ